jgi:hypothetical protein
MREITARLCAVLVSVLLLGCTATIPSPPSSPGPSVDSPIAPSPDPTVRPTDGDPFKRELWLEIYPGQPDAITYESLEAITDESDLLVVGQAARIERGPDTSGGGGIVTFQATVTFHVDEVLSGTLRTRAPNTVAVRMLLGVGGSGAGADFGDRYARAVASLPKERTVLFLLNLRAWAQRFGPPADARDADPMGYTLNGGQSWFRDQGGRVGLASERQGSWPDAFEDRPFEEFLGGIRVAAGG